MRFNLCRDWVGFSVRMVGTLGSFHKATMSLAILASVCLSVISSCLQLFLKLTNLQVIQWFQSTCMVGYRTFHLGLMFSSLLEISTYSVVHVQCPASYNLYSHTHHTCRLHQPVFPVRTAEQVYRHRKTSFMDDNSVACYNITGHVL